MKIRTFRVFDLGKCSWLKHPFSPIATEGGPSGGLSEGDCTMDAPGGSQANSEGGPGDLGLIILTRIRR